MNLATLPRRLHTLSRNLLLDLRFGGRFLGGSQQSRFRDRGAAHTVNTSYRALDYVFRYVPIDPSDVLVDVGCGKGRVLNWWLNRRLTNSLVGIELDPDVADGVARRLHRYRNVSVMCGDASELLPSDATILYLYNPFAAPTLARVKSRIERCCRADVTVIYYNPRYIDVFSGDANWTVTVLPIGREDHLEHGAAICRYTRPALGRALSRVEERLA